MNLKLLEGVTLRSGSHNPGSEMCAMEAAAYIAGEPWSDHPECVCPVIAAFVRSWNDGLPSNAERDRLLKPLIPKIIGTRATAEVEKARSMLVLDWYIRTWLPAFLRLCPATVSHADEIAALPQIAEENAKAAGPKVAAARAAVAAAAGDAAGAACWAVGLGDAARAAAGAACWAAAGDAAGDAASAAASAAAGARAAVAAAAGARAAAAAAAWAAAGDALASTVSAMQDSACDLVRRMCEVK